MAYWNITWNTRLSIIDPSLFKRPQINRKRRIHHWLAYLFAFIYRIDEQIRSSRKSFETRLHELIDYLTSVMRRVAIKPYAKSFVNHILLDFRRNLSIGVAVRDHHIVLILFTAQLCRQIGRRFLFASKWNLCRTIEREREKRQFKSSHIPSWSIPRTSFHRSPSATLFSPRL